MNKTLKSALIELHHEGVDLDPIADLEHILTLDKLSREISSPRYSPGESAILRPILRIGKTSLYRLSMGARRFLMDVVDGWIPKDMEAQDKAYAFCMAKGNEPEILWALQDSRAAFFKAVQEWEKTIGVPFSVLREAVKEFQDEPEARRDASPRDWGAALDTLDAWRPLPEPYKSQCIMALDAIRAEREDSPAAYGRTVEILCHEYGRSPTDWLWRTPEPEIDSLLANRRERMDRDEREKTGAQDDRFMRAHKAFCDYKDNVARIKRAQKT